MEALPPSTFVFDDGKRWSTGYNPHEHMQNVQTPCRDYLVQPTFWSRTFLLWGSRANHWATPWERRSRGFEREVCEKLWGMGEKGVRLTYICLCSWLNNCDAGGWISGAQVVLFLNLSSNNFIKEPSQTNHFPLWTIYCLRMGIIWGNLRVKSVFIY